MDEGYLEAPTELDQLPEGAEVQVHPIPITFTYKKVDGRWVPIDWDPTVYSEPLVEDRFSLGTIAIDPDGVGYVKGFVECSRHTVPTMTACLCARPIRWLRVGRMPGPAQQVAPLDDSNALPNQTYLNEGDTLGGSAVHLSFPELRTEFPSAANIEDGCPLYEPCHPPINGYDYLMGGVNSNHSDNGMTGGEAQPSTTYGFKASQASSAAVIGQTQPIDTAADDALQEIQAKLVPDGFTIHFDQEGHGIPLEEINLLDNESPAFRDDASLGKKASIRFKFNYWQNLQGAKRHADKRRQVNVRRGRCKVGIPISLRAIANHVRSELVAEMNAMADLGYPLCHRGARVNIEEFVLVRIERTRPGTLQPVFSIRR